MQFEIIRVSAHRHKHTNAPCKGAVPFKGAGRGRPPVFVIEINTLDALLALQKEVAVSLILGAAISKDIKYRLVIYDDPIE